jgi:hypothetical protein
MVGYELRAPAATPARPLAVHNGARIRSDVRGRWLETLGLVLCGAMITVIVQWLAVLRTGGRVSTISYADDPTLSWPPSLPTEGWPAHPYDRQSERKWGASRDAWVSPWIPTDAGGECRVYTIRTCGWPFRSAASRGYTRDPVFEYHGEGLVLWTTKWPAWLKGRRANVVILPVRPLWLGFAADAAVYSTVVAGCVLVPGVVRRRLRIRAGRCPACGYQIMGMTGPCPECGRSGTAV